MLKLLEQDIRKVKLSYNISNNKKSTTKPFLRTNIFVCRNVRLNLVRASRCVCACELVYARQDAYVHVNLRTRVKMCVRIYTQTKTQLYIIHIYMYEL